MVRQHKTRSSLKKEQAAGATHPAEQKSESNAIVSKQSEKTRSKRTSCIFLLRKHNGVPAKYRSKARTLCGAKPQAQTGSPREKSLIFRVGQKANTPQKLAGCR